MTWRQLYLVLAVLCGVAFVYHLFMGELFRALVAALCAVVFALEWRAVPVLRHARRAVQRWLARRRR